LDAPDELKDRLPATITSAAITADQRAPNVVPALIADLGDEAAWRCVEFFHRQYPQPAHAAGLSPGLPSPGARNAG
jgi:hypothetical protein